jgi:hypothetical protein
MKYLTGLVLLLLLTVSVRGQYISEVLEYKPAPGQFINTASWGSPHAAQSLVGTVSGSLSLGSFGGYVIFTFEKPVENHPDNPFGVDFTVFGNPLEEWSEHGIVSVMKDENENGLPDDIWYELAGSEYFFSSTIKNYEVTYTNPGGSSASDVPWSDTFGNSGFILSNSFHTQPYYPLHDSFPDIDNDSYNLSGTRLADEVDRSNPAYIKSYRKTFGYADNQLRGSAPYTVPDNPYTPEKENSGGDAFDISWAVNEAGDYIYLDEITFVKVQNGVLADAGWLGEVSTEITGAVDVSPDNSLSGITDVLVIKDLPDTITGAEYQLEIFAFNHGRWNPDESINWTLSRDGAEIDSYDMLRFSTSGMIKITASFASDPEISASDSALLIYKDPLNTISFSEKEIHVYPNPASDFLSLEGIMDASLEIFSLSGTMVSSIERYTSKQLIPIAYLPKGMYIIRIVDMNKTGSVRFIKE